MRHFWTHTTPDGHPVGFEHTRRGLVVTDGRDTLVLPCTTLHAARTLSERYMLGAIKEG
jgi:hypothetical protein